jgi:transposase
MSRRHIGADHLRAPRFKFRQSTQDRNSVWRIADVQWREAQHIGCRAIEAASASFAVHLPVYPACPSGYAGEKVTTATLIAVEIVRKNPDQVGFAVNPRRWVVERFFAWIGRNRRLAKDFEATIDSARASLYAASVMLLVRRIARAS